MSIVLDSESLQKIDSLLDVVDTILALPIEIEMSIDELTLRSGAVEDSGADDSPER